MSEKKTSQINSRLAPLYSLLLLLAAAPALAALAAPHVYRFLQSAVPENSVFDAPFHRVTSRLVLIAAGLMLYPAFKLSGLRNRSDLGFARVENRYRLVRVGAGLGIVSMLLAYLPGLLLGVFGPGIEGRTALYVFRKVVQIAAGGLFIGIFEEIFFRGFIFKTLKKSLGLTAAILLGSFLFSIVHFMRPVDPETVTQWNSGFLLAGNLFARAGDTILQEFCTLFMMGVVLSLLVHWTRSVYIAIGLHAGWVWVMMFFRLFADNRHTYLWLYGTSDWVSKAWAGPILALAVLAAVLLTKQRWKAADDL